MTTLLSNRYDYWADDLPFSFWLKSTKWKKRRSRNCYKCVFKIIGLKEQNNGTLMNLDLEKLVRFSDESIDKIYVIYQNTYYSIQPRTNIVTFIYEGEKKPDIDLPLIFLRLEHCNMTSKHYICNSFIEHFKNAVRSKQFMRVEKNVDETGKITYKIYCNSIEEFKSAIDQMQTRIVDVYILIQSGFTLQNVYYEIYRNSFGVKYEYYLDQK